MKRKVTSAIMAALLLASVMNLALCIQPIWSGSDIWTVRDDGKASFSQIQEERISDQLPLLADNSPYARRWNSSGVEPFGGLDKWSDFAFASSDAVELIVGVGDAQPNGYSELADLIVQHGGEVVDAVSMGDRIHAVVVNISSTAVPAFAFEAQAANLSRYIEPNMRFNVSLVPDDPLWPLQWGPLKLEADHAWETTIGDPSVVVAIIDTGVDWNHPDLAANIWNNADEVLDGEDNDNNGYIDDVRGWDFVHTSNLVWPGEDGTVRDNDPMDFHGHGTHCSGIVAAVGNNSKGITGLSWNTKIMAVRAGYLAWDGYGYLEINDAAEAIVYAVDNGADIISMSWGSYYDSELIYNAVRYAYDAGTLLIAAAGNDATSIRCYPAAYSEVIAVAATDRHDNTAWWSNWGKWVELTAPGVNIYSTFFDNSYTYMSGTSMAAPCVAGVAALVKGHFPGMPRDCVRFLLRHTTDDLGEKGFDVYYGYGRVNARKAVEQAWSDRDLLILDWEKPLIVKPWNTAIINTTVFNYGKSHESNVTVQLLVNGSVADSRLVNQLESGALATVSLVWTPTVVGTYNVTCYVVPVLGETVTEDNVASGWVVVRIPAIMRVPDDYSTIQGAINAAYPTDIIQVAPGTYYESVVVNKTLTLIGQNNSTTIIDAQGKNVVRIRADYVNITGFTLQDGTSGICIGDFDVDKRYYGNIITGNVIRDSSIGIFLFSSDRTSIIDNLIIRNGYGIKIGNPVFGLGSLPSNNNTILRNSIIGGIDDRYGVSVDLYAVFVEGGSYNNVIQENKIYNASYGGISVGSYTSVYGNTVIGSTGSYCGISVGGDLNTIVENTIRFTELGIYSDGANTFLDNVVEETVFGVHLVSSFNLLRNNEMSKNRYSFIISSETGLAHAIHNDIDGSNVIDGRPILYLVGRHDLLIEPSTFPSVGYLALIDCHNIIARSLTLTNNGEGILLFKSDNIIIEECTIENNLIAVAAEDVDTISIEKNKISKNLHGILLGDRLDYSYDNKIIDNEITHNSFRLAPNEISDPSISHWFNELIWYSGGLYLRYTNFTTIIGNTISYNENGIYMAVSCFNTFRNNAMIGNVNNFGIDHDYDLVSREWYHDPPVPRRISPYLMHDVDASNTINGKPIYWWINQHDRQVPTDAGYVALINSTNIIIRDLVLANNTEAILLVGVDNTLIYNNTISDTNYGIYLIPHWGISESTNNTIAENQITKSGIGIRARCINSTISCNLLTRNLAGVFALGCRDLTITRNMIVNNTFPPIEEYIVPFWPPRWVRELAGLRKWGAYGAFLESFSIVFNGNTIEENDVGIGVSGRSICYHNNFLNNTIQVVLDVSASWDNGYPSGGNYWSDYSGVDFFRGLNQDAVGCDGIGDTPYFIEYDERDRYPLTTPFGLAVGIHDITILDATTSVSEAYIGWKVSISITARNNGESTENFTVTAYCDNKIMQTKTASNLAPNQSLTLAFDLNTYHLTPGDHIIAVGAAILPGETNKDDNVLIDGTIKIKISGDVNGDNKVDIRDIAQAASAFGSYPSHSRWSIQADVNQDGKVDIKDLALISKSYGKTYP